MSATRFGAIVRFEVKRTLRKPAFWTAAILLPLLVGGILGAVNWSTSTATNRTPAPIAFEFVAPPDLIPDDVATANGWRRAPSEADGRTRVESGRLEALLVFRGDSPRYSVDVYAQDRGIFANGGYASVAKHVFDTSVDSRVGSPSLVAELRTGVAPAVHAYADGQPAPGLGAIIPPAFLMVLLIVVIALLGNQMLNVTVEEKENRISEMLLVSVTPGTLLRAKVAALALVGLVQIAVVSVPTVVLGIAVGVGDTLSAVDIGPLVLEPARLVTGGALLIGGLLLTASALVLIGAIMPTAKDAAPFLAIVILGTAAPMYLITSILVDPTSPLAVTLTFIPIFSAATGLMRNAVGGIAPWEAAVACAELVAVGTLLFVVAARLFQRGALSFGVRVRLRSTTARDTPRTASPTSTKGGRP